MPNNSPISSVFAEPAMLIGGEWVRHDSLERHTHLDPSTGLPCGSIALGGPAEAKAAIDAACAAFPAWRKLGASQRRDILLKAADLLSSSANEFAAIAATESGHPYNPANVQRFVDYFRYYAGWTEKLEGSTIPVPGDALNYTHHEPYGVVLAISSWNGPTTSAVMKVAPALAAGNCVVLKAPEFGPFGPLLLGRILSEAGLPPGVLNIVTGGPALGEALVADTRVGKISFTGSIQVGRQICRSAAENMTPVVMELGGKSANIIFEDADLDRATTMAAHMGCVQNAGQGCLFPTRLLVQDSVYERVVEKVLAYVAKIKVGLPFEPGVQMGPVINERSCERILSTIENARQEQHGELLCGGSRLGGELAGGYFISPTVFGEVDNKSTLAQQEIFGPVLSIIRFNTEEEAVALANDTVYGLAGYVHTRDIGRAHRVAAGLDAGYIGINGFPPMPTNAPFGGFKQSGYGREGGKAGIEEYLRTKNVYVVLG
ncbi:aldehyde dehydrogenase (NAD+) [Pseudomonas sp. JAI111]|uniref:aldehyde dehydrogenase family protein n=1 Tax=Pseudomonas sp. JAI111 TaxID=2735913 RepID=UPI0021670D4D|nr:aldehyde dehydrogenase family protein [Pseudomonas sp. JAI111]MCS3835690.1 aldehyde dehydrogenase (NAD+) [Pseudomonas sp. JAI111]